MAIPKTPEPTTNSELCDPCQVKVPGGSICGYQGRSLGPHLKCHKRAGGKSWVIADYKKKFPKFSVGRPAYVPPPEHVSMMHSKNPVHHKEIAQEREELVAKTISEAEEAITARQDELWNLCERDPAAHMFCLAAARDEALLRDAYRDLEVLTAAKEYEKMRNVNSSLAAIQERLNANMKSLSLTVEQRRKSNQLGSDSVSQLISGFANVMRKKTAESFEAFQRRVTTVNLNMAERIRVNILDAVDDNFDQTVTVNDENDYRSAILEFGKKAG